MSARLLALACLPLVVVAVRMYVEAGSELAQARRSEPPEVAALGRAARRYLPFGPSAAARQELAQLGRRGVAGAYEELRASILACRGLLTPDRPLLDEAERAIAQHSGVPAQALAARHEPSRPLTLLALGGAVLFLGGVARALSRPVRYGKLVAALGLGLFLIGLWRA